MEKGNENFKLIWQTLSGINVNEHVETKKGADGRILSYLSWAWAWGVLMEHFPDATYEVREWDGMPYLYDENLGYLVETSLTILGETRKMRLPVMNGANKAVKSKPYTYQTKYGEKQVEVATMFDVNTATMRCLVKNMALFGLGHYIYAGEDLPQSEQEERVRSEVEKSGLIQEATYRLKGCATREDLKGIYDEYPTLANSREFKAAINARAKEIGI